MNYVSKKPPYSKCRRLQLCYRCEKYCSRTKNMCPTCETRDARQRKILAPMLPFLPTFKPSVIGGRHFVGTVGTRGLFIVWNDRGILDRATYREIAAEAKEAGVTTPYLIYGRIASYTGPGMDFQQVEDGQRHWD